MTNPSPASTAVQLPFEGEKQKIPRTDLRKKTTEKLHFK
ncbi:hypothetical protein OIU79_007604, partial [Salix purpurea]